MTDQNHDFADLVAQAAEPDKPDTRVIEDTLLTGLFTSPEAAARILSETRPNDYYYQLHRELAAAVYPALNAGDHVDLVTFRAGLATVAQGDPKAAEERQKLHDLADQVMTRAKTDPPALGKVEAYLSIFVEGARRRLAKNLIKRVEADLEAGDLSPVEAGSRVFETVVNLEAARRLVGAFKSEGEDWPAYFAALEARQSPGREFLGLNTGFDHLNNVANGLTEGLFVLGAAPSTGKTTFAKQLTDQVAELNPNAVCLFVSLEQSREELRVKTLSRLSGVENRDILRGRLDISKTGWSRVRAAAADYQAQTAGRVFVLEGDKTTTPARLRLAALQVRRATKAEALFVVVDYLQIVPTEEDYRDQRARIEAVVSDLRRLARDLGASVLAVSSLSRDYYEKSTVTAFKESGGIEYGADLAAILMPSKDKIKGNETIEGVLCPWDSVHCDVVKNRNGERARVDFRFFKTISRFVETDKQALPDEAT